MTVIMTYMITISNPRCQIHDVNAKSKNFVDMNDRKLLIDENLANSPDRCHGNKSPPPALKRTLKKSLGEVIFVV